ncbi:MAG: ATP-binding protein [Candidatus Cloacimonas sp.]|jgi:hypothetical protein|nr:ATP-binding protein [Candidatus Cloacimonas sp.]
MNKSEKTRFSRKQKENVEDTPLAQVLFDISKSRNTNSVGGLYELFDCEEGIEQSVEDVYESPIAYCENARLRSWARHLGLDTTDLMIISFLWRTIAKGRRNSDVSDVLLSVFDSPALAYQQMHKIRHLLSLGIVIEEGDVQIHTPFMPFVAAQYDKCFYSMNLSLSQPILDFITGKAQNFSPYRKTPFTSDNEHLMTWIMLWKAANRLYQDAKDASIVTIHWSLDSHLLVKEMLDIVTDKEAATAQLLRFRSFRLRYHLTMEEVLLFLMLLNIETKESEDMMFSSFIGQQDDNYELHKLTLNSIKDSNLVKHNILSSLELNMDIEQAAARKQLCISNWVKHELLGLESMHDSGVATAETQTKITACPLYDVLEPAYKLRDIIVSDEQTIALQRVISFKQDSTLQLLSKWGIDGYAKKNSHRGFSVLLHGSPGTGKTLAAEVIAGEMGKQILKTDSSHILSKYFGKAEQNAKELFVKYYGYCQTMSNPPVLLFNEADQLLNNRISDVTQSVDKAWNAIQNIILEALENPMGIIIATTNLIECLDEAYSRRFDLILCLTPPAQQERMKIWKVRLPKKLPGVATLNLEKLSQYELTGGQITKVIRNAGLHLAGSIAKNKKLTTEQVCRICELEISQSFESKDSKHKAIGFR